MAATISIIAVILGVVLIPVIAIVGAKLTRPNQQVPGFGTRMRACPYPLPEVATLLADFIGGWDANGFGGAQKVKAAIDVLDIYWVTNANTDRNGPPMNGLTINVHTVNVVGEPLFRNVRRTALAHELVHVALWATTGQPDADHTGSATPGWTLAHDAFIESLKRQV